jgi:hypothetical protein
MIHAFATLPGRVRVGARVEGRARALSAGGEENNQEESESRSEQRAGDWMPDVARLRQSDQHASAPIRHSY